MTTTKNRNTETKIQPSERARESVQRLGYAAIGGPLVALKAVNHRVDEMSRTLKGTRATVKDALSSEMDRWVSEGRKIFGGASATTNVAERAFYRGAPTRASRQSALVPDEPLTTINGIGPTYAARLADVGVGGISDFLGRTGTAEDIGKLAESTGFSAGTIESWRSQADLARVDGVGGSYQQLLHRGGIWTLGQLASSDPERLVSELTGLDTVDGLEQMPSIYSVKKWRSEAKRLVTSNGVASG
jgi:predicted flap endonuclease-1-like 5' DNA nuclease